MALTDTFDASRLARLAYHAMIENAAKIQAEIVQQEAVNARFGDDALPVNKIMRGFQNNLRDGVRKRDITEMRKRHDEFIAGIREFEALFEIEEKEDMQAFAREFKRRMRESEGK